MQIRGRTRARLGLLGWFAISTLALGACNSGTATPILTSEPSVTAGAPTPGETPTQVVTPSPAPSPTPAPTRTPPPTATPVPPPATPVVNGANVNSSAADASWKVTFRKPVVSAIPAAVASAINTRITSTVNTNIALFTTGLPPMVDNVPSTLDGTYSVAFDSPTLLSLRLDMNEFISGAAHPSHITATLNFVVATGVQIQLTSLFTTPNVALSVLSTQSRLLLKSVLGPDAPTDMIDAGTGPDAENFKTWAFTPAGLEITFQEYSVAPYALGMPRIVIPWAALTGLLKPSGPAGEFVP